MMALRICRHVNHVCIRAYHVPVLKNECIDYLMNGPCPPAGVCEHGGDSGERGLYLDCTLGGGGHTTEILNRGGKVIALDQDLDAIDKVSKDLSIEVAKGNLEIIHTNFANVQDAVMSSALGKEFQYQIDGALFDLGVSSHQIDQPDRGFAYRLDGALDMRMNRRSASLPESSKETETACETEVITALQLINNLSAEELAEVFFRYGDETRSEAIAREIVLSRPLGTTVDLKDAICSITPPKYQIKTLSRCFQALRIAVNNELPCLEAALSAVHALTRPTGRLVVLSYHSLEDKIIKDLFRDYGHERRAEKAIKYSQHQHVVHRNKREEGKGAEARTGVGAGERSTSTSTSTRRGVHVEAPDQELQAPSSSSSSSLSSSSFPLWRPVFKKPVVPSRRELKQNSRSRSAKLRVAERV